MNKPQEECCEVVDKEELLEAMKRILYLYSG